MFYVITITTWMDVRKGWLQNKFKNTQLENILFITQT